jgi:hypothetical protein
VTRDPAETAQQSPDWPKVLLCMEGAALLVVALFLYDRLGFGWGLFAILFFAPDLTLLFYFSGPRAGAVAYNIAHVTFVPLALGVFAFLLAKPLIMQLALIHLAHIGFDRALGFGLKYPTAFNHTHLGSSSFGRRAHG